MGKTTLMTQNMDYFFIPLPFFVVIVIEKAGHVAVITTIAFFLNSDNIAGNGEMYDTGVSFFTVGRLIFCKV